jgi:pseudouridine synthase
MKDKEGRKTAAAIVGELSSRVFPVGRLDYHTTGLLLFTNDGELAYKLTHPKFGVEKTYIAKVKGIPTQGKLGVLRRGLPIDGVMTSPAKVNFLEAREGKAWISIRIAEGNERGAGGLALPHGKGSAGAFRLREAEGGRGRACAETAQSSNRARPGKERAEAAQARVEKAAERTKARGRPQAGQARATTCTREEKTGEITRCPVLKLDAKTRRVSNIKGLRETVTPFCLCIAGTSTATSTNNGIPGAKPTPSSPIPPGFTDPVSSLPPVPCVTILP